MEQAITIRKATKEDIPDIVRLRRAMFEAMGETDPAKLDAVSRASAHLLACDLEAGGVHIWLAVTESDWPVASGGLTVDRHLPAPNNPSGRIAYIMNMFTHGDYRRQGVARKLMQTMLQWINEQGITKVALHASEDGETLYRMLGFKPSNEMQLDLVHESRP
ncbi:MAG: GNAT family N-acetyltransferase [Anaerolineae bacterium]|nr:GNAT family N-acetyltransferase [Anaerolineae bacterium]